MRPADVNGPAPADTNGTQQGAGTNANAGHAGPQSSGSRNVLAPTISRRRSLAKEHPRKTPHAELSGAENAGEEMDNGAVGFRQRDLWAAT